ncbi:hypothetical protein [Hoeflea sp. TYP-13]|uniref:hypothetical protein n=1 Tax=Hoeflea sp. TYP-13 TaxID=3230023 RepID=UPI0034C6CA12
MGRDTYPKETAAAWERLAKLYLEIQVAADLIASSDSFDPENPEAFDRAYLADTFPAGTVEMILHVATLMGLAVKGIPFSGPTGPSRTDIN